MRTTKWLRLLTNGAFATIQWQSLTGLFDIHPPPKCDANRNFSESFCSAVSSIPARATSNAHSSQRDFKAGPWSETPQDSPHGITSQSSAWRNSLPSTELEEVDLDRFWFEVCQGTRRGKTSVATGRIHGVDVAKVRERRLSTQASHCRTRSLSRQRWNSTSWASSTLWTPSLAVSSL